jgi:DNA-binding response OmpR family regulator
VLYPLSYEGETSMVSPGCSGRARRYHAAVVGRTVLVIDDDPVIVELLRVNFELEGFSVICAAGGEEGLALARSDGPDVVVSDVMMPEVSGLDVLTTLKAEPATSRLPVLLLSARAQSDDVERGLELGADGYVTKPFDPAELVTQVSDLADRARGS